VRAHVVTIFPELFGSPLSVGPLRRAREIGCLDVSLHQLRDYTTDRHATVDDVPYGGGHGMVMKPEPLVEAIEHVCRIDAPHRILLSARGTPFTQAHAAALAERPSLLLVCGRYEGVDERVRRFVDEEVSVGDYVLSGGELPALVVLDAIVRLLPGVLGNAASPLEESFTTEILEYSQYTRPAEFRGERVPDVLLSGDHGAIARWRREQALRVTWERRPELLARAHLDDRDQAFLRSLGWRSHG
jgi:tRNA (guanine37-N1)-methyltransferase